MKEALARIVCGLFGLAAAVVAIAYAVGAIRAAAFAISWALGATMSRDGAVYILPPLISLTSAFAASMLLRRSFRRREERQTDHPQ